ncbi:hypothetical protein [Candidatus Nanohalococcus occultus]|uniref:Uncharacterized protein n=1 Tax=Candidatus Nanohalococcus occultus TaxID=2978047 RepID=A0ABY8CFJ2_9ARCH|nr:hypothetical protein SVXNc_1006 [Candidatus Nanohaloarchaeota archaeon SVXNc]
MRKGVAADVLAITIMFGMSLTLSGQSLLLSESVTQQTSYVVDDLRMVSRASSAADSYLYDYAQVGVERSIEQKTLEKARAGGDISWTGQKVSTFTAENLRSTAVSNLETASESYFHENYVADEKPVPCRITNPEIDIAITETQDVLKGELSPENYLAVECSAQKTTVTATKESSTTAAFNSRNNRYGTYAAEAAKILYDLQSEWEGNRRRYTGTASACGTTAGLAAEANSEARSDAYDLYSREAEQAVSTNLEDTSIQDEDYRLSEVTETRSETDSSGVCSCDPEPVPCKTGTCTRVICDKTEFESVSEIRVDEAQASMTLKDDKYKILGERGFQPLEFKISDYTQSFNSD